MIQCFATWVVRSVDEVCVHPSATPAHGVHIIWYGLTMKRPKAVEGTLQPFRTPQSLQMQAQAQVPMVHQEQAAAHAQAQAQAQAQAAAYGQAPAYSPPSRRPARSHARAQLYPVPQNFAQPFGMYDAATYPAHGGPGQTWQGHYPAQAQMQYAQPPQHAASYASVGRQGSTSAQMSEFGLCYGGHAQGGLTGGYGYAAPGQGMTTWEQGGGQGIERPFSPYDSMSDQGHGHAQQAYGSYAGHRMAQPGRAMWYGSTGWSMR